MSGVKRNYHRVFPIDVNRIVNLYLGVPSMQDISVLLGISKTKVHNVLHEADSAENLIFLRHNLAVNLRKGGLDTKLYADLIRARNVLAERNIQHGEDIPSKISGVVETCYRLDLHPQILVSRLGNFRTFVLSMDEISNDVLEDRLGRWFENWAALNKEVDKLVQLGGWLRAQIDTLKRLPHQASGSKAPFHRGSQ